MTMAVERGCDPRLEGFGADARGGAVASSRRGRWFGSNLLLPVHSLHVRYLPVLILFFATGAIGLIDVTRDMWIKERLTLSLAELAAIAVWLTLPSTMKMVVGELVDKVPILGSRRKSYVFIGAGLIAAGMLTFAAAAGGWHGSFSPNRLYFVGAMLITIGLIVQDVVALAMSAEAVARVDANGAPRSDEKVRSELGTLQALCALSLSIGYLAVAGLSGWLAAIYGRDTVFLICLIIPAISIISSLLAHGEIKEPCRSHPIDFRISGRRNGFRRGRAGIAVWRRSIFRRIGPAADAGRPRHDAVLPHTRP